MTVGCVAGGCLESGCKNIERPEQKNTRLHLNIRPVRCPLDNGKGPEPHLELRTTPMVRAISNLTPQVRQAVPVSHTTALTKLLQRPKGEDGAVQAGQFRQLGHE
jgi:hypothetical protein